MASEKYELKAKNKVISTGANDHISVTEPVEVTGNAFCAQNSLPATDRMPSEVSDTSAQFGKEPSEGSYGFARLWKMLSEVSDTSARFGNMPSEGSDASTQFGKTPSEVSDASARFGKVLSETSDGFIRSLRSLTSFCLLAQLAFSSATLPKSTKTRACVRFLVHDNSQNVICEFCTQAKGLASQTFGVQNKLVDHRRMFAMANHK